MNYRRPAFATKGSTSPEGALLALTAAVALLSGAACQLQKDGYCRLSEASLRVLPGNFSRAVNAGLETTTDAAGSPITVTADLENCTILSFSDEFDQLMGDDWILSQIGPKVDRNYAHESAVYLAGTDDVFFTSKPPENDTSFAEAWLLNLGTGTLSQVNFSQPLAALNSATKFGDSQVLVGILGSPSPPASPSGIALLDPYTGNSTVLVNNWLGLRLYGLNDLVTLADGSIVFNVFNSSQPVQRQASLGVWILPPEGPPRVLVADLPESPNGMTLAPDNQTLYVTTFISASDDLTSQTTGNKIYAFDLVDTDGGVFAENQRLFAAVDLGFPDGLKADASGNIFATAGDGLHVFSPGGQLLGKILLENTWDEQPSQNVVFAGNRLVILHHTDVLVLTTNTTGAVE